MNDRVVHVITPGDHYSPSTGSAVVTVVHGMSKYRPASVSRPAVAVARGTYPDRYDSATAIEYDAANVSGRNLQLDIIRGAIGLRRRAARTRYAPTIAEQASWPESAVVGHNAVQLARLVDTDRHLPVLYAHNELLRTYRRREAGAALDSARLIIAVSNDLAGRMADALPARLHSRIAVIRNGVDTDEFHPEEQPGTADVVRVVFVGRMVRDKGADILVHAVGRLQRPDIHLTIVGSAGFDPSAPLTPYERSVRSAAAATATKIDFLPFVPRDRAALILRSADVVVVPSRWPDPCPLTVLEGMASGAAVIGSDIGGIPETLTNAGILVPPGNVSELAGALESLADDDGLLRHSRERCLDAARERTWSVASSEFHTLLARAR